LQETRRRELARAAEERQRKSEGRGVKDPEGLKMKQKKREEAEKLADRQHGDTALKVSIQTHKNMNAFKN